MAQTQEARRREEFPNLKGGAIFGGDDGDHPDGIYRYVLTRAWGEQTEQHRTLGVIGLNPSTADAERDDMTIGRCLRFAKRWGFDRLLMVNLFAYRTSKPSVLVAAQLAGTDIVGKENDAYLIKAARGCSRLLAAWGAHPLAEARTADLFGMPAFSEAARGKLMALKLNGNGSPGHPLYMPSDQQPESWWPATLIRA